MDTATEEKLHSVLLDGETVEWTGKSRQFPLLTPDVAVGTWTRWIICLVGVILCSVLYAKYTTQYQWGFELVIIIAFAYAAIIPMMDRNKLLKKCEYYVTNKRIILWNSSSHETFAMNRAGVKVKSCPAGNGCISLMFGTRAKNSPNKARMAAVAPQQDEERNTTGMGFYCVEDSAKLRQLLGI